MKSTKPYTLLLVIGLVVASFISVPGASASTTCTPFSQSYVSNTSTLLSGGGNAVETYTSPIWTTPFPGSAWIWSDFLVTDPENAQTRIFLLDFNLPGSVISSSLKVSADDYFKIRVNGTEIASEFGEGNFLPANIKIYNPTSSLTVGTNTIAFEVTNAGYFFSGFGTPQNNPGGLLFSFDLDGETCVTTTSTPPSSGGGGGGGGGGGAVIFVPPSLPSGPSSPTNSGSGGGGGSSSIPPAGSNITIPLLDSNITGGGSNLFTQIARSSTPETPSSTEASSTSNQLADISSLSIFSPEMLLCALKAAAILALLIILWLGLARWAVIKKNDVDNYFKLKSLFLGVGGVMAIGSLWYLALWCVLPFFLVGILLVMLWDLWAYSQSR